MKHERLDTAQARTTLLVEQLQPIILREIAAAEKRAADAEAETRAMMSVCRDVGKATDRLLQAMHSRQEGPARAALERAVFRLREQMRKTDGR